MLFLLFVVVFWMVFVGAIVEVVLAFRWNRRLYRQGFVIFRREYPLADLADAQLDLSTLHKEFRGFILPPLVFRQLATGEYGFREGFSLRPLAHSSLMHGLIRLDAASRMLIVEGRLFWFNITIVGLAVLQFLISPRRPEILAALFGGLVLIQGTIYVIQATRFGGVARLVHEQLTTRSRPTGATERFGWK